MGRKIDLSRRTAPREKYEDWLAVDAVMCELLSGANREKFREYPLVDEFSQSQTCHTRPISGNLADRASTEQGINRENSDRMLRIHHGKGNQRRLTGARNTKMFRSGPLGFESRTNGL